MGNIIIIKVTPKFYQETATAHKRLQYYERKQDQLKKKLVALLYTNDKRAEKEIREISPFTIVTNNIKYLEVLLAKEVKDLYKKKKLFFEEKN